MRAELHVIAEHGRYVRPLLSQSIHEYREETLQGLVRAWCACGNWDSGQGWSRPVAVGFRFARHVEEVLAS